MSIETVNKRCWDEVVAICKLLGLQEGGDFPLEQVRALIEENKILKANIKALIDETKVFKALIEENKNLKNKIKAVGELIDKWMEKYEKS